MDERKERKTSSPEEKSLEEINRTHLVNRILLLVAIISALVVFLIFHLKFVLHQDLYSYKGRISVTLTTDLSVMGGQDNVESPKLARIATHNGIPSAQKPLDYSRQATASPTPSSDYTPRWLIENPPSSPKPGEEQVFIR